MPPSRDRSAPQRTGILVIRVWLDQEASGQLRARLTQAADLGEASTTLATAGDVRGIRDAVEAWLQQFLDSPGR